LVDNGSNVIVN